MPSDEQWTILARILRPQGRRGEVLADLFTEFPQRFASHPHVWLAAAETAGAQVGAAQEGLARAAEVTSHWLPVGRNAGRIVLLFAGIDSIEQAEKLAGMEVVVPISERVPLDEGAAYISDLIGCTVYDREVAVGVVEDVQFPTAPDGVRRLEQAAPLLAVKSPEGDEVLVPFASAFVLEIDTRAKAIRMALPEGLTKVNRP
jgi:16S rRNA processing protein RimM